MRVAETVAHIFGMSHFQIQSPEISLHSIGAAEGGRQYLLGRRCEWRSNVYLHTKKESLLHSPFSRPIKTAAEQHASPHRIFDKFNTHGKANDKRSKIINK